MFQAIRTLSYRLTTKRHLAVALRLRPVANRWRQTAYWTRANVNANWKPRIAGKSGWFYGQAHTCDPHAHTCLACPHANQDVHTHSEGEGRERVENWSRNSSGGDFLGKRWKLDRFAGSIGQGKRVRGQRTEVR